jgi:hypothetical protein
MIRNIISVSSIQEQFTSIIPPLRQEDDNLSLGNRLLLLSHLEKHQRQVVSEKQGLWAQIVVEDKLSLGNWLPAVR